MKIINNNFDSMENVENFDFDEFIKQITKYIASYNLREEEVSQIYVDLLNTVIEYSDGKEYVTRYNGAIKNRKYPSNASAFHTLVDQVRTDNGFEVSSGIVLRSKIRNNLHTFVHEFFHASSEKRTLTYKNNVLYTKGGLSLSYWDQEDELINGEYRFRALNEGVTEMLTQAFLNEKGQNNYLFQVVLAKILTKYDSTVIKAYFSREESAIISFSNKFNELQNTMTSSDFANTPQFIFNDKDLIFRTLKACIQYSINYCKQMNIPFEKEWIFELASELDNDINYELENNSYTEIVNEIFNQTLANVSSK
jgi:hypothetical protein